MSFRLTSLPNLSYVEPNKLCNIADVLHRKWITPYEKKHLKFNRTEKKYQTARFVLKLENQGDPPPFIARIPNKWLNSSKGHVLSYRCKAGLSTKKKLMKSLE